MARQARVLEFIFNVSIILCMHQHRHLPRPGLSSLRTYLFCAIRPEVTYHKYTFATLGFAKNASVVKLKPKMTTVKATLAEKKLMEELEQMKVIRCYALYVHTCCTAARTPLDGGHSAQLTE